MSAFSIEAEGATREEALEAFRTLLTAKLQAGVQIVSLSLKPTPGWVKYIGTWNLDDPLIQEWKKAVEEYRQQMDEVDSVPGLTVENWASGPLTVRTG